MDNLVRAKGASRMAITDLGKFRASCRSMVASNSQGASAKQAYDLLFPMLSVASLGMALESVGFLASHYCDTPALVGVGLDERTFTAKVLSGTVLSDQALKNAMYVVGEDRGMRNLAMAVRGRRCASWTGAAAHDAGARQGGRARHVPRHVARGLRGPVAS